MSGAMAMIKFFGKALQIDIGSIHHRKKFAGRRRGHITSRHRHSPDIPCLTGPRHIHGIFQKYDRIIIGKSHRPAAELARRLGDHGRRGVVIEPLCFSGLADVPVLAKFAGKIASCRTEGQNWRARQEMIQRLFLNRIDAKPRGTTICRQNHLTVLHPADKTKSTLAVMKPAEPRTEITLYAAVRQAVPMPRDNQGAGFSHLLIIYRNH